MSTTGYTVCDTQSLKVLWHSYYIRPWQLLTFCESNVIITEYHKHRVIMDDFDVSYDTEYGSESISESYDYDHDDVNNDHEDCMT